MAYFRKQPDRAARRQAIIEIFIRNPAANGAEIARQHDLSQQQVQRIRKLVPGIPPAKRGGRRRPAGPG